MVVLAPIRLDHVKRTIRSVFVSALAGTVAASSIVWVRQQVPRAPRPLVAMRFIVGPMSDDVQAPPERRFRAEIDSVDVTVDAALLNTLYRVRLNGIPYEFTTGGAATLAGIRDALRDLVNNVTVPQTKQSEAVTAADVGGDGFAVTPDVPGAILDLQVLPSTGISRVVNTSATDCVMDHVDRERMRIQVDVYSQSEDDEAPEATELGAYMIARRMVASLNTEESSLILANNRVAVRSETPPTDLSALEAGGAAFETRSQFDLIAFASSRVFEAIVPIESVEITTNIAGLPPNTFTVS